IYDAHLTMSIAVRMKQAPTSSLFLLCFFLAFSHLSNGQTDPDIFTTLQTKLSLYKFKTAPEKVYVHTDKDFYLPGDTMWFKVYLVDGATHKASTKSKVVYIELLDESGQLVAERKIFVEGPGAEGDIQFARKFRRGRYILRAFTKYMLNEKEPRFFQKGIIIWTPGDKSAPIIDNADKALPANINSPLQVFPESGRLIEGVPNRVVINAGSKLLGDSIRGKIVDGLGQVKTNFEGESDGMIALDLLPEPNMEYFVIVNDQKPISLPKATPTGSSLKVNNNQDHLLVEILSSKGESLEGALLLGHVRGTIFLSRKINSSGNDSHAIKVMTGKLASGIAHLGLFNKDGKVLAERLTLIDNRTKLPRPKLILNKNTFEKRDRVGIKVKVVDELGLPLKGNFSMSVVKQDSALQPPSSNMGIENWFLFNADIGEVPWFFSRFFNKKMYSNEVMDIFMMTQNWTRFKWEDLLKPGVSKTETYTPEKGIMINGSTTALDNKYRPKSSTITLGLLGEDSYYETKISNGQGKFSFGPFAFNDSIDVVLDAIELRKGSSKNTKDISIYVDPPLPNTIPRSFEGLKDFPYSLEDAADYYENVFSQQGGSFEIGEEVVELEEATVTAEKKTRSQLIEEELNTLTPYGRSGQRVILDSLYFKETTSLMDLINLIPGVQVKGNYPAQVVKIRSGLHSINLSTEPLFLLDGVAVPFQVIQQMKTFGVLFVDLLVGAQAAFYGVRGANGVIAVYTDRGFRFSFSQERYPGITNFTMQGFNSANRFEGPNHGDSSTAPVTSDYRTTLHWEPNIEVDGSNHLPITFYTGDSSGSYLIRLEGVTESGLPLSCSKSFTVE
ncbi:MAG: hypothetical protein AB3N14_10525, partial [Flavobacteriaceae bacterium]